MPRCARRSAERRTDRRAPGTEIIDELAPHDGDIVIAHTQVSGFMNTSLDLLLRSGGIDTLIVTGVATNITVDSTARHASDLGYRVIVLSDCTMTDPPGTHEVTLNSLRIVAEVSTAEEVIKAL